MVSVLMNHGKELSQVLEASMSRYQEQTMLVRPELSNEHMLKVAKQFQADPRIDRLLNYAKKNPEDDNRRPKVNWGMPLSKKELRSKSVVVPIIERPETDYEEMESQQLRLSQKSIMEEPETPLAYTTLSQMVPKEPQRREDVRGELMPAFVKAVQTGRLGSPGSPDYQRNLKASMSDKVSGKLYNKLYEMRTPVEYCADIDNSREDYISDEEDRNAIKDQKNEQRAYRDDRDVTARALDKLIKQIHQDEKKIIVQSAISENAFDLSNNAKRQSALRELMTSDFNSIGDEPQLLETPSNYIKVLMESIGEGEDEPEPITPVKSEQDKRLHWEASFITHLQKVREKKHLYGQRLDQFNKNHSTVHVSMRQMERTLKAQKKQSQTTLTDSTPTVKTKFLNQQSQSNLVSSVKFLPTDPSEAKLVPMSVNMFDKMSPEASEFGELRIIGTGKGKITGATNSPRENADLISGAVSPKMGSVMGSSVENSPWRGSQDHKIPFVLNTRESESSFAGLSSTVKQYGPEHARTVFVAGKVKKQYPAGKMFDKKQLLKKTVRTSDHNSEDSSMLGECPTHRTRLLDQNSTSVLAASQDKSLMYNTMATNMAENAESGVKHGSMVADSSVMQGGHNQLVRVQDQRKGTAPEPQRTGLKMDFSEQADLDSKDSNMATCSNMKEQNEFPDQVREQIIILTANPSKDNLVAPVSLEPKSDASNYTIIVRKNNREIKAENVPDFVVRNSRGFNKNSGQDETYNQTLYSEDLLIELHPAKVPHQKQTTNVPLKVVTKPHNQKQVQRINSSSINEQKKNSTAAAFDKKKSNQFVSDGQETLGASVTGGVQSAQYLQKNYVDENQSVFTPGQLDVLAGGSPGGHNFEMPQTPVSNDQLQMVIKTMQLKEAEPLPYYKIYREEEEYQPQSPPPEENKFCGKLTGPKIISLNAQSELEEPIVVRLRQSHLSQQQIKSRKQRPNISPSNPSALRLVPAPLQTVQDSQIQFPNTTKYETAPGYKSIKISAHNVQLVQRQTTTPERKPQGMMKKSSQIGIKPVKSDAILMVVHNEPKVTQTSMATLTAAVSQGAALSPTQKGSTLDIQTKEQILISRQSEKSQQEEQSPAGKNSLYGDAEENALMYLTSNNGTSMPEKQFGVDRGGFRHQQSTKSITISEEKSPLRPVRLLKKSNSPHNKDGTYPISILKKPKRLSNSPRNQTQLPEILTITNQLAGQQTLTHGKEDAAWANTSQDKNSVAQSTTNRLIPPYDMSDLKLPDIVEYTQSMANVNSKNTTHTLLKQRPMYDPDLEKQNYLSSTLPLSNSPDIPHYSIADVEIHVSRTNLRDEDVLIKIEAGSSAGRSSSVANQTLGGPEIERRSSVPAHWNRTNRNLLRASIAEMTTMEDQLCQVSSGMLEGVTRNSAIGGARSMPPRKLPLHARQMSKMLSKRKLDRGSTKSIEPQDEVMLQECPMVDSAERKMRSVLEHPTRLNSLESSGRQSKQFPAQFQNQYPPVQHFQTIEVKKLEPKNLAVRPHMELELKGDQHRDSQHSILLPDQEKNIYDLKGPILQQNFNAMIDNQDSGNQYSPFHSLQTGSPPTEMEMNSRPITGSRFQMEGDTTPQGVPEMVQTLKEVSTPLEEKNKSGPSFQFAEHTLQIPGHKILVDQQLSSQQSSINYGQPTDWNSLATSLKAKYQVQKAQRQPIKMAQPQISMQDACQQVHTGAFQSTLNLPSDSATRKFQVGVCQVASHNPGSADLDSGLGTAISPLCLTRAVGDSLLQPLPVKRDSHDDNHTVLLTATPQNSSAGSKVKPVPKLMPKPFIQKRERTFKQEEFQKNTQIADAVMKRLGQQFPLLQHKKHTRAFSRLEPESNQFATLACLNTHWDAHKARDTVSPSNIINPGLFAQRKVVQSPQMTKPFKMTLVPQDQNLNKRSLDMRMIQHARAKSSLM